MLYIDLAILNLTERSCQRFQRLTGRTNVWLAIQLTNLSIIVYFIWAAVYFWSTDTPRRILIGLFCSALLYGLTQTIFKEPIETYELNAYRRVTKGLRNPRRISDSFNPLVLSNPTRLHQPSRRHRSFELFADRPDDDCVVLAGLRSASAGRREAERMDSTRGSLAAGCVRIVRKPEIARRFPTQFTVNSTPRPGFRTVISELTEACRLRFAWARTPPGCARLLSEL